MNCGQYSFYDLDIMNCGQYSFVFFLQYELRTVQFCFLCALRTVYSTVLCFVHYELQRVQFCVLDIMNCGQYSFVFCALCTADTIVLCFGHLLTADIRVLCFGHYDLRTVQFCVFCIMNCGQYSFVFCAI